MYTNKLKKIIGLIVSVAMIAGSIMIAPFTAMAAERNLVNYDFESTGTELTSDVIVEKGEGRSGDNANDGGAAIDSGALKINVVANTSGTNYNQNYYSVRVKIPYSGLEDDENLKISFDTWDLDDVFDINWQQFGTLVNSNGNMVVWGRRDGSTEYKDRWAGFGGTAEMLLAGFKANGSYDTTNAPGSAGYDDGVNAGALNDNNVVGAAGAKIDGTTKHTICYDIERETGLVTVTIDGTQTGTFYVLNQLTASGYLDFRGWTYTSNADTQYIDNVKITAYKEDEVYVPDTQLPLNYDFETTGTVIGEENADVLSVYGVGDKGDVANTGSVSVSDGMLKFAPISHSTTGNNQNYYQVAAKIPYSGLGEGDSLKISFEAYAPEGRFDTFWRHFGTLVNSDNEMVVYSRRDNSGDATTGGRFGTAYGGRAHLLLVGMKDKCTTYNTDAELGSMQPANDSGITYPNAGTVQSNNSLGGYAGATVNDTNKHSISYVIDRDTEKVTVIIDDVEAGSFYVMNPLTDSGHLLFYCWAGTTSPEVQYVDNIKIEKYEAYTPDSTIPVNYDFETTGTVIGEENADVISFKGVGKSDVANTGSLSVENGALKFAPLDGKNNTDVNQNYYHLTASIPYSGLGENESLKISFDTQDPDASFNMMWRHFGTLVNSDDKMVLWSRRDTQTQWAHAPGRWGSGYGGTAQLLFVGMKEKCTTYNTTAIPGSICPASDSEVIFASGGAITNDNYATTAAFAGADLGANNVYNVSYIIDRSTDLVTVSLDGTVIGSFYMMNELTSSGTLLFYGCTMANTSEVQYIDNVKIEKYVPSAQIGAVPFTYDFSSNDTTGLEISYGTGNGDTDPNTSSVAVEDGKVKFIVNNTADTSVTEATKLNDLGLSKFNAVLEIPYNGLKDGENLKVSFKYKDNNAVPGMKWSDFGSLKNSAGKMVVGSRRDGSTGMNRWNTGFGAVNQLLLVGYKEKLTTYDTAAVPGTNTTGVSFGSLSDSNVGFAGAESSSSAEHTVTYTVNSATDEVVVTIDGKLAGKFYAINELTSSGSIVFKTWEYNGTTDSAYIDDVSVSAWKPLTVETTNLTAEDYDAAADIELTFTNKLGCDASVIKQALTITTADDKVVPPANITVSIAEDGKTAVVDIAGGLRYGKTSYTLTLAEDVIYDESDLYLEDGYTFTFVTKFAKGMYISSVADQTVTATNVSLKATITNPTADAAPAWVVLAVYDAANKVIGLDTATVASVTANGGTESVTLSADISGTADRIQLLMWDSSESLTPYHIPIDVE